MPHQLRVLWSISLIGMVTVAAMAGGGCGGSSSSSSSPSGAASAEPSAEFLRPSGGNTIAGFGREASAAERKAADEIVVESLHARQSGDWAAQCATLNEHGLAEIPGDPTQKNCPHLLAQFARPISATKEIRKDRLPGAIDALRIKGDKGYALFHGTDGKDYALALEKEDGAWKVSSVNTIEI